MGGFHLRQCPPWYPTRICQQEPRQNTERDASPPLTNAPDQPTTRQTTSNEDDTQHHRWAVPRRRGKNGEQATQANRGAARNEALSRVPREAIPAADGISKPPAAAKTEGRNQSKAELGQGGRATYFIPRNMRGHLATTQHHAPRRHGLKRRTWHSHLRVGPKLAMHELGRLNIAGGWGKQRAPVTGKSVGKDYGGLAVGRPQLKPSTTGPTELHVVVRVTPPGSRPHPIRAHAQITGLERGRHAQAQKLGNAKRKTGVQPQPTGRS